MDYRQAVDYLLGFANFEVESPEKLRYRDFNLTRVNELLRRLGDPHLRYPTAHVAGTKGKGSVCAMTASAAQAAGLKVGLYTSPHLHTIRERIQVDGEPISAAAFAETVAALQPAIAEVNALMALTSGGRITTFEALTALAFRHFAEQGVDLGVIEVGLGGRLDATNVVAPAACAITSLSLDHVDVLGGTLPKIAAEKAAIIKPGVPAVSAPQPPDALAVVERAAERAAAPLRLVARDITFERTLDGGAAQRVAVATPLRRYDLRVPLAGRHQAENAAVAVGLCEALTGAGLPLTPAAIADGIASVRWPARMETIPGNPVVLIDGAHNPFSMRSFKESLSEHVASEHVLLIFGANRSKDLDGMVAEIAPLPRHVLAVQSRHPKSAPPRAILAAFSRCGVQAEEADGVAAGIDAARQIARPGDVIVVTGSLFAAAEAREHLLGISPEIYAVGEPSLQPLP